MSHGVALVAAGDPTEMTGPFLLAQLRAFDKRIEDAVGRVVARTDENAVHDLRVALRRSRTLLDVGRPVLGRFCADEVRTALRDGHRISGALRDEEVLLELLVEIALPLGLDAGATRSGVNAGVNEWIAARRRREQRLRMALRRALRGGAIDHGRHLLAALMAFRIKPSRDRRVSKFARRAVESAQRDVERRRSAPLNDAEALHRLRLAYKKVRYTVETFASALPADVVAIAQPSARMQSRLGQLHDAELAIAVTRAAPNLGDRARSALLVELARVRQDRANALEHEIGIPTIPTIAFGTSKAGS